MKNPSTTTILVTKGGFSRSVTVLTSRLLIAEIATLAAAFLAGYIVGRL